MNEYVQKYEHIEFDLDKMREAVEQLIKIRPFERQLKKKVFLNQMQFVSTMMKKNLMNGLVEI
jgi:hypothetical protein